jgi:chromosome segregation ATPase
MFRTRKELAAARIEIAKLETSLTASVEQTRFMEAKADAAAAELVELKLAKAILTERLDLLTNYIAPAGAPGSLNVPNEEAEDLQYAFDNGMITGPEFEAALAATGLQNTHIKVL